MDAKLVVVGGDAKTTEIQLKLPTVIGRGKDCKVRLQHPLISRQHCEIFEAAGQLMVRDLGSLNGTFINNERITEAALPAGQLLTVGAVTFRAVYGEASQKSADDLNKTAGLGKTVASDGKPATADTSLIDEDTPRTKPAKAAAKAKNRGTNPVPAKLIGASDDSMEFDLTEVEEVVEVDDASGILPPSAVPKGFKPAPSHPHAHPATPPTALPISPPAAQPAAFTPPPSPAGAPSNKPDEDDDDLNSFLKSLGK